MPAEEHQGHLLVGQRVPDLVDFASLLSGEGPLAWGCRLRCDPRRHLRYCCKLLALAASWNWKVAVGWRQGSITNRLVAIYATAGRKVQVEMTVVLAHRYEYYSLGRLIAGCQLERRSERH